jgi:hypothetical protein
LEGTFIQDSVCQAGAPLRGTNTCTLASRDGLLTSLRLAGGKIRSGAPYIARMEAEGDNGDLVARVSSAIMTLGGSVFGFDPLPNALAMYIPAVPPRFLYRTELNQRERALAFVHELAHASLHPPGSEGDGGSDDPQEERCAHEAARLVCVSYGVNDYIKMMASHGVIPEALLLADQPFVDLMVDRIGEALENPNDLPAWASPGSS